MSAAEDQKLTEAFVELSPEPVRVARMQVRVVAGYDARPKSLALEWWSLLRARPLTNGALMAAAALILFFTTPMGALAGLLGRLPTAGTVAALSPAKGHGAAGRPTVESRPRAVGRK